MNHNLLRIRLGARLLCGGVVALAWPTWAVAQSLDDVEAGAATKKVEKKASLIAEEKPAEVRKKKEDDDALKKGEFNYERLEELGFSKDQQRIQFDKSKTRRSMIKTMADLIERKPPDNAADIYFRLAETWWDETHYVYLLDRAEYNKKMTEFDKGVLKEKPVEPVENYQRSITYYEKVLQQYPNYGRIDEVLFRLGKAALQQGKALGDKVLSVKGVQYLNQLVQKHQNSKYIPQTHLALAEHFFEANNLTLAKMNYERITQNFKTAPMFNYALYKLGWVYYNLREFRRTIETFQEVVKVIGKERMAGKIEFRDQALKDLVQAFGELDRGWPEAEEYFVKEEGAGPAFDRMLKLADIYMSTDKDDNAIELYTHFIDGKPTDKRCIDWHDQIITVRKKIASFADLEGAVRKFLAFTDERTSPWVASNRNNAEYMDKQQKMGETLLLFVANKYHQDAQKSEEENKDANATRDAYAKAAADYREFVRRYPRSGKAYIVQFYFAEILFDQLKDFAGANSAYKKVIELDKGGDYVEDAALGVIYSVEELMRKTRASYKDAKWVDDPTAATLLPEMVSEKTEFKKFRVKEKVELTEEEIKAAQVPKKAQELHPLEQDYVMAADKYVELMFEAQKRCREKKKDCDKGKKVPEIMYLASTTYYDRGQYPKAIERLEKTFQYDEKNKVAEISVKTMIDIYARHKDWVNIETWARKMLARPKLEVFDSKDLRKYVAVSVAEQAVELAERKDFDGAHKKYDTILTEFRKDEPELAATALYNKAAIYELQKEDVKAITTYERVVKDFPKAKIAPEASFNIGMIYESMTQFKEAADAFLTMTKFRDNADAAQALINAGQILGALQQHKEAAAAYDKFITVAGNLKGDDEGTKRLKALIPDAEMEKGHILERMGSADGAKLAAGVYGSVLTKYPARPDLAVEALGRRAEQLRMADPAKNRAEVVKAATAALKAFDTEKGKAGRAAYFAAQASFHRAEYDFDDFDKLTLKDVKKMTGLLAMLQKKAESLKKAELGYFTVIDAASAGNGRAYAAAAAFKIGLLYFKFKEDLFNAPTPPQIAGNQELEEAYHREIEKIAVPIEEQSLSALGNAINMAHNLGVYNKWSKEAGEYAAKVNPNQYPTVETTTERRELPKAVTAVSATKLTDAATSAAFITQVRRGKFTVSYKPKSIESKPKEAPKTAPKAPTSL
ncbi:MAG: tetratricopeptide repeat protein [Myxococcales bacterium]|nr:tetratricopeptide repeat protein [Myxococcales bacterium]